MKYQEFLDIVAKYVKDENDRLKWIPIANELFDGQSDIHPCGNQDMVELPGGSVCLSCGNHFINLEDDN
jgi:hypothetical protein